MKSGFKDRTAIKEEKKMKSPWNFEAPSYDQRTSCFVDAGTNYGLGMKQPVGTERLSNSKAIPTGRIDTMKVSEVFKGRPNLFETHED